MLQRGQKLYLAKASITVGNDWSDAVYLPDFGALVLKVDTNNIDIRLGDDSSNPMDDAAAITLQSGGIHSYDANTLTPGISRLQFKNTVSGAVGVLSYQIFRRRLS